MACTRRSCGLWPRFVSLAATCGEPAVPLDDWATAQSIWRAWPGGHADIPAAGTCLRLRDALTGVARGAVRWRDVTALTRQVLLEHHARTGAQLSLVVPLDPALPHARQWESALCATMAVRDGLRISAEPWAPPSDETGMTDLRQVYAGAAGRALTVPADPFWTEALGPRFTHYTSQGQRQAARTVATAPPGATVIACLPTGQGKTEVAWASVLLATRHGGVAVMVVPTVVLALDMERRLRQHLHECGDAAGAARTYAYTGGQDQATKEAIRRDIRSGQQRVVIAAPEALMTGLNSALDAAAAAGHLTHLVIDEAHIVEQWGNDFRPEFQAISAKRRSWLDHAPSGRQVVTVAMSATLTATQVQTLTSTFGGPGPVEVVWASHTRPEPIYFVDEFGDRNVRDAAVLEAVGALPRPLILYTTTREDAELWCDRLDRAGFGRITRLTGESTEAERRAVLAGWRGEDATGTPAETRFDVVVGTSAFGLGVDMPNVRAVVHACLPETIDRYYQEVGRGGRDGRPCVAYLATAPGDLNLAERVNRMILIGDDRGWLRWQAMRDKARWLPDSRLEIDLIQLPPHLHDESARNMQWNVKLLNLMERAHLIRQEAPAQRWGQNDDFSPAGSHPVLRVVTELDGRLNDRAYFEETFSAQRHQVKEQQRAALRQLSALLKGDRCVADVLAEHYRVPWDGGVLPTARFCRSCPYCRRTARAADSSGLRRRGSEPWPDSARWPHPPDPLAGYRGGSPLLSIAWSQRSHFLDLVPDLIEALARRGYVVVGGPALAAAVVRRAQRRAAPHPIIVDGDHSMLGAYDGPLVWLLDDARAPLSAALAERLTGPDPTYLVHPADLPDPHRPDTPLRYMNRSISLDILVRDSAW
ncbi:protein DpdF [Micromonospora sp. WMMD1128]|uniref:protein DpdF n=1 Tax=Micromonospora sp. WMMD1128 TaxID=3015150 RepID=UPI00248AA8EC|nr:protein DpdF [Micromonospora sp. WMMD1128]WBB72600.1 protein DpdF [Micromonospora sp. WMMD1128]